MLSLGCLITDCTYRYSVCLQLCLPPMHSRLRTNNWRKIRPRKPKIHIKVKSQKVTSTYRCLSVWHRGARSLQFSSSHSSLQLYFPVLSLAQFTLPTHRLDKNLYSNAVWNPAQPCTRTGLDWTGNYDLPSPTRPAVLTNYQRPEFKIWCSTFQNKARLTNE